MYDVDFFFFQAEDGIRDRNVTGVQTCALPISNEEEKKYEERIAKMLARDPQDVAPVRAKRSEERRVGKEGRAMGSGFARKAVRGGTGQAAYAVAQGVLGRQRRVRRRQTDCRQV